MSEKMKHLRETLRGVQALKREVALRFGLLGQLRKPDRENLELMVALSRLNQELEAQYLRVKQHPAHSPEEEQCLMEIRLLEDERFQLLNQLNGAAVQKYGVLPVMPGA